MNPSSVRRLLLGIYLVAIPVLLGYFIIELWPRTDAANVWKTPASVLGVDFKLDDEIRMIALVVLIGALGSYVHVATSFASYVGNKKFIDSWTWWYVLRPFIGVALALIFYFIIRGGLLSVGTGPADANIFGIAAISGLVGMFSKHASDKLREVFDHLFRTAQGEGDDQRADKLRESRSTDDK